MGNGPTQSTGLTFDVIHDGALRQLRYLEHMGMETGKTLAETGIDFRGWVTHGYTGNTRSPLNGSNSPTGFNDQSNLYLLNQLYMILEKDLSPEKEDWSANLRLDLLYGSDYFYTTAVGLETYRDGTPHWNSANGPRFNAAGSASLYGMAMPQFFIDAQTPIAGGLGIKVGHFYSPIAAESVMAADNFFSSHSMAMLFGMPRTHTGMIVNKEVNEDLSVQLGMTRGWDNYTDENNQLSFLGGFKTNTDYGWLEYSIHSGDDTLNSDRLTVMALSLETEISDRLGYGMQASLGLAENVLSDVPSGTLSTAKWYGIANYFIYQIHDTLDAGLRVEWFYDQSNSRIMGVPIEDLYEGGQYVNITLGANYFLTEGFLIRPELRWDWSDTLVNGFQRPFVDFNEKSQITLSFDMIYEF